jgi:hypothetical protein
MDDSGTKGKMFLIRHENGTYFAEWATTLGPTFGADQKSAMRFHSYDKAVQLINTHQAFDDTRIVIVDGATAEAIW